MKLGSLCSGAGGLDLAVEQVFGAETAWHCEIDDAAAKVLAHRWTGVPNHRDLTATDWGAVEPIDILTGGYPCQPFSHAGKRKGTDDERHIWPDVREAIRRLRPRYTFLENVAGHRSLGFDRVLGDLAEDGLHVRWTSVRASDVGAPHRRERLFILVTPPDATCPEWGAAQPEHLGERRIGAPESRERFGSSPAGSGVAANVGHTSQIIDAALLHGTAAWGKYAPAIHRWEQVTRPAPSPTEPNRNGNPRLNPAFSEWMQGWPDGWVTAVPGISRNDQLRIIGNGVVPQCASVALRWLLSVDCGVAA